MDAKQYGKYLVKWIQDEVKNANLKGVVVGISGGVDSAVVTELAKRAFPDNSIGVWMGIESSTSARRNCLRLIEETKIRFKDLDLSEIWKEFTRKILDPEDLINETNLVMAIGSTKARLRMSTLYQIAKSKDYLVLGTSNRDEIYMGYFTKWGDGSADIYPLANLSKGLIYELAKELKINERIINAKPSADLWENQDDETDMGVSYQEIDDFLNNKEVRKDAKLRITNAHNIAKHKVNENIKKPKNWER